MNPEQVYLGLGSNLEDRAGSIDAAVNRIRSLEEISHVHCSTVIETEPVGGPPQDNFLNAVIGCKYSGTPEDLLRSLQEIESDLGRTREVHWGPRTIDIDILLMGDQIIDTPVLTIPHPFMLSRLFVLKPLFEIAPEAIHPVAKKTISELLQQIEVF